MIGRAALLLALATTGAAAQTERPALTITRYDEAWSVIRDAEPTRWSDRFKYIPLVEAAYLTLGLDLRARNEDYRHNLWGAAEAPDDGYLLLRAMPYADLHVGPARAFVQPIAAYAFGVDPAPGPVDQTRVDFLQGFADVALPLGDTTLTLRGGRELLSFGSERLVGTRWGPNVPLGFDGARAILAAGPYIANLIYVQPVEAGPDSFDDEASRDRRLWGLYATRTGPVGVDAYYLGYENDNARWDVGSGREERHTFGIRLFDSVAPLHFNVEGIVQLGTFAGGTIGAWSVATEFGHTFDTRFRPDLTLRINVASGDGNRNDNHLGTFNALFPKGKYFGELSPVGPYNIININPTATFDLGGGVAAGLNGGLYFRASTEDGIYDVPGHLVRSGAGSDARFIGAQAEATIGWQATDALEFSASASLFTAGDFIRETGPADTILMLGLEAGVQF